MSRRPWCTRAVFSSWPVARWNRRLNRSFLSLTSSSLSWSSVINLTSAAFIARFLIGDAFDEARLDRELRGGERQGFARDLDRHAVDFEHDASGLDAAHPQLRRTLALAHAYLDRLLRHGHIGEHPDPHAAGALHVPRHRPSRRLDLARGDAIRLDRLEPVLSEIELGRRGRLAVNAALVRLAEFAPDRLQHDVRSVRSLRSPIKRRRAEAFPLRSPRGACPAPSGRAP